jgi:glycosyltransferase involved in cell wall biosynthesis
MVSYDFYPSQVGGQGIYAYEICNRLANLGHEVHAIVSPTPERISYFEKHKHIDVVFARGKNPLLFTINAYREFKRHYNSKRFDVLHGNEIFTFSFALKRPNNIDRLIAISHNSYRERCNACSNIAKKTLYLPYMFIEKMTYSLVDDVIVGSEMEGEAVIKYYGINRAKVHTVYYGTYTDKFAPLNGGKNTKLRQSLGIKEDEMIVLFVGRLVERKKPHLVLEAMREVIQGNPHIHCIFVGDGKYREKLEKSTHKYGLLKNVHIVGAVSYDDLPQYYASSDIFVLPSEGEGGVSLVLLEAAASGLPLIITRDASSYCPILKEGVNGYLIKSSNHLDISEKILLAAKNSKEMGQESRTIVTQYFTWDKCIKGTLEVYGSNEL